MLGWQTETGSGSTRTEPAIHSLHFPHSHHPKFLLTGLNEVECQMVDVSLHHLERVLGLRHALSDGSQQRRRQEFRPVKLRSRALIVRRREAEDRLLEVGGGGERGVKEAAGLRERPAVDASGEGGRNRERL